MRTTTKRALFLLIPLLLVPAGVSRGQAGGNVGYGQAPGRSAAEGAERAKRTLTREELPPTDTAMFIDASVLMNVKADAFVATFGLAEEGKTVQEAQTKLEATLSSLTAAFRRVGVAEGDLFVDFAAQTKLYGFKFEGNLAREELAGFEIKKLATVRYRDKALIDRLVVAASEASVYDLVKVDYVVTDPAPIEERLAAEAAAVIKAKAARYRRLLGVELRPTPRVVIDRAAVYTPTEMYQSYVSGESEEISGGPDRQNTTVRSLRRSRTFHYSPLGANGFDRVIEPVILEPVVQFTLYQKLRYDIEPGR